jgi:hypothetical protein
MVSEGCREGSCSAAVSSGAGRGADAASGVATEAAAAGAPADAGTAGVVVVRADKGSESAKSSAAEPLTADLDFIPTPCLAPTAPIRVVKKSRAPMGAAVSLAYRIPLSRRFCGE